MIKLRIVEASDMETGEYRTKYAYCNARDVKMIEEPGLAKICTGPWAKITESLAELGCRFCTVAFYDGMRWVVVDQTIDTVSALIADDLRLDVTVPGYAANAISTEMRACRACDGEKKSD